MELGHGTFPFLCRAEGYLVTDALLQRARGILPEPGTAARDITKRRRLWGRIHYVALPADMKAFTWQLLRLFKC